MKDIEDLDYDMNEDLWAQAWLDKNYGGAPNECSFCYREGKIVLIDDCTEHDG